MQPSFRTGTKAGAWEASWRGMPVFAPEPPLDRELAEFSICWLQEIGRAACMARKAACFLSIATPEAK